MPSGRPYHTTKQTLLEGDHMIGGPWDRRKQFKVCRCPPSKRRKSNVGRSYETSVISSKHLGVEIVPQVDQCTAHFRQVIYTEIRSAHNEIHWPPTCHDRDLSIHGNTIQNTTQGLGPNKWRDDQSIMPSGAEQRC